MARAYYSASEAPPRPDMPPEHAVPEPCSRQPEEDILLPATLLVPLKEGGATNTGMARTDRTVRPPGQSGLQTEFRTPRISGP